MENSEVTECCAINVHVKIHLRNRDDESEILNSQFLLHHFLLLRSFYFSRCAFFRRFVVFANVKLHDNENKLNFFHHSHPKRAKVKTLKASKVGDVGFDISVYL